MSTTLTSVSKKLLQHLPTPIAVHWGVLHRANNDSERLRQCWAVLDSFLRYSAGMLLADYIRKPEKVDAVEELLPKLERPSLGHYCAIIRETLRSQSAPDNFFSHLYEWYYTPKGKPSENAKLLDSLITKRNHDAHGVARTETELKEEIKTVLFELQTLLHKAKWLSGYQLFQVTNTQPQRRGGQRGSILSYVGDSTNPLPKAGAWSCTLFEESMYLSHPSGESFLEVNPFTLVEQNGRTSDLYLWVSTPKGTRIDLRCASTSNEIKKLPLLLEESVSWSTWLDRRAELDPIFHNTQVADFVAEDFQEIGMRIGDRYRVLERLGEGGMGMVYLVEDELLDETVALKVLHLEQVDSTERERTKAEFKFMKSIQHPHILPVKSLDILKDGRITISMPLMEGTLKDLMGSERMNPTNIAIWTEHVLSALDFLHQRKPPIFHRDIKPSNMLIDKDGLVYISDFGIARQDGDVRITRTAEQMGSLPYMAPELLLGHDAGAASDRFALGVSLHEMLMERLPKKTQVGKGIEGDLGEFVRMLGSEDLDIRMSAVWPLVTEAASEIAEVQPKETAAEPPPIQEATEPDSPPESKENVTPPDSKTSDTNTTQYSDEHPTEKVAVTTPSTDAPQDTTQSTTTVIKPQPPEQDIEDNQLTAEQLANEARDNKLQEIQEKMAQQRAQILAEKAQLAKESNETEQIEQEHLNQERLTEEASTSTSSMNKHDGLENHWPTETTSSSEMENVSEQHNDESPLSTNTFSIKTLAITLVSVLGIYAAYEYNAVNTYDKGIDAYAEKCMEGSISHCIYFINDPYWSNNSVQVKLKEALVRPSTVFFHPEVTADDLDFIFANGAYEYWACIPAFDSVKAEMKNHQTFDDFYEDFSKTKSVDDIRYIFKNYCHSFGLDLIDETDYATVSSAPKTCDLEPSTKIYGIGLIPECKDCFWLNWQDSRTHLFWNGPSSSKANFKVIKDGEKTVVSCDRLSSADME